MSFERRFRGVRRRSARHLATLSNTFFFEKDFSKVRNCEGSNKSFILQSASWMD